MGFFLGPHHLSESPSNEIGLSLQGAVPSLSEGRMNLLRLCSVKLRWERAHKISQTSLVPEDSKTRHILGRRSSNRRGTETKQDPGGFPGYIGLSVPRFLFVGLLGLP